MNEFDPSGKLQHEAGAKLDAGKPRADLVLGDFSRALIAVSEVGTYGAQKYTDRGWLAVDDGESRYTAARLRHWLFEAQGKVLDSSGLMHAAQTAWNALARLELALRRMELEPENTRGR